MTTEIAGASVWGRLRTLVRPALVALLLLGLAPVLRQLPGGFLLLWWVVFACMALGFGWRLRVVVLAPRREAELADRLCVMLDRACAPGWHLVEIRGDSWASAAGQEAVAIDVRTGGSFTVWFAQAHFPTGSMVLVDDLGRPVDWLLEHQVTAAHRHQSRRSAHATSPRASRTRARAVRLASNDLLSEAEDLLRSGG